MPSNGGFSLISGLFHMGYGPNFMPFNYILYKCTCKLRTYIHRHNEIKTSIFTLNDFFIKM